MITLLITAAGVAAFEIAAVKFGSDSRVDTRDGRYIASSGSRGRRWI